MIYIGIDPGANGAVAWIDGYADCFKFKDKTMLDIFEDIEFIEGLEGEKFCMIERVSSSPQMGVKSAFTFGHGYGMLVGFLTALRIPHEFVTPAKWQGSLSCRSKGNKNITKAKAQQLFPDLKITHGNADALLIAEYCRRIKTGELK